VTVWAAWLALYAARWLNDRDAVLTEARDPTSSFFTSLAPVATMIASVGLAPHWPGAAWAMALVGLVGVTLFAAWGAGTLWMGDRAVEATTPILYMPTVGGGFVAAITCATFGMKDLGLLYFGAGLLSWLALESVVLNRMILRTLPVPLRASLGLHLAPPAVACVAYLAATDGPPYRLAQILFGYALFHALVMVRLVPWLRMQPFSPATWAYTFGVSALPLAALRLTERGLEGPNGSLAIPLFIVANLFIGWTAIRTIVLSHQGKLPPGSRS
jgi:tellurite resistance protein